MESFNLKESEQEVEEITEEMVISKLDSLIEPYMKSTLEE